MVITDMALLDLSGSVFWVGDFGIIYMVRIVVGYFHRICCPGLQFHLIS